MLANDPFEGMSIWSLGIVAVGYYSPTIIAFFQNDRWPKWAKVVVTLLFHALSSLLYLGSTGKLTGVEGTPVNYLVVFAQLAFFTQLSYRHIWSPTNINLRTVGISSEKKRQYGLALKAGLPPKEEGGLN